MPPRTKKPEEVKPVEVQKPILYPHVCVTVCGTPEQHGMSEEKIALIQEAFKSIGLESLVTYAPPLTAVDAATQLGLETETKENPFKEDWVCKDWFGHKMRASKNPRNRPIYMSNVESIEQDVLNARWELNGETVIHSDTGDVLDGQHTYFALYRAQQRVDAEKLEDGTTLRWKELWPDGVVKIPKIIVYGIKGIDKVVNTMNTCRPRGFADVIYRSPYFANLKPKSSDGLDRETAARVTDHAVRNIWHRTGLYLDGFSSKRTNSEGVAWLESHGGMEGKFFECVRHILEEQTKKPLADYVTLGYAAAMMWIMACGESDQEKYYGLRNADDDAGAYKTLTWKRFKKAMRFWSEFADHEPGKEPGEYGKPRGELKGLTEVLDELKKNENVGMYEIDFVIARAWKKFLEESRLEARDLGLRDSDWKKDGTTMVLVKRDTYGSIDVGIERKQKERPKVVDAEVEEQTEAAIAEANSERQAEIEAGNAVATTPVQKNDPKLPKDPIKDIRPQVMIDLEQLHKENPQYNIILMRTTGSNMEVWGPNTKTIVDLFGGVTSTHPNGTDYSKFDVGDWDGLSNKATDAGFSIAMAQRVEGVLTVLMGAGPAPKKTNGKKQK